MVRVGEMRMAVQHRLVPVLVAVPRAGLDRRLVHMVVMRVARAVDVLVPMLQRLVPVAVFVALRKMQRHPDGHQHAGRDQRRGDRFAQ